MLRKTFAHIPGIGVTTERRIWSRGIDDWGKAASDDVPVSPQKRDAFRQHVERSVIRLESRDARYFSAALPAAEQWRLYRDFHHRAAYLDIETTGTMTEGDAITTIALYDGRTVRHYVNGQNLNDFAADIADFDLLVTYNGKCFDAPFIERYLRCPLPHAHLDLRYVLHSLGLKGGLKSCERQLGFSRDGLADVDGFFAVLLWQEYQRTRDEAALQTLLAYNVEDVLTLERLAVLAFNRKLTATPFADELSMPDAEPCANPFEADQRLLDRLRDRLEGMRYSYGW